MGYEKRSEWTFQYSNDKLLSGAKAKKEFHEGRLKFWSDAKEKAIAEVKDTGLTISESAAGSNYSKGGMHPRLVIDESAQDKVSECHSKCQEHAGKVAEYDAWVQVLSACSSSGTQTLQFHDYLYFFGTK